MIDPVNLCALCTAENLSSVCLSSKQGQVPPSHGVFKQSQYLEKLQVTLFPASIICYHFMSIKPDHNDSLCRVFLSICVNFSAAMIECSNCILNLAAAETRRGGMAGGYLNWTWQMSQVINSLESHSSKAILFPNLRSDIDGPRRARCPSQDLSRHTTL